jgi:hypothetical protein
MQASPDGEIRGVPERIFSGTEELAAGIPGSRSV